MKLDINKIANVILYMLHKKVKHLDDKKVSIMIFLMDYNHHELFAEKIFGDEYIKNIRNPQAKFLGDIFDIIANEQDLKEDDQRLYVIQELLGYLDIAIIPKDKFIQLNFLKMEEDFDEELFSKKELITINKVVNNYSNFTNRNIANETFKIQKVRQTNNGDVII